MKIAIGAALAALAVAVIVGLASLGSRQTEKDLPRATEATDGTAANLTAEPPALVRRIEQIGEPVAEPRAGNRSSKLVAELEASKDWRAFALAARSRPEEGGYLYAMYVSNLCGMGVVQMPEVPREAIAKTVARTSTISAHGIELAERLMSRCASFAPDEASSVYLETQRMAADNKDPFIAAKREASNALKGSDKQLTREALSNLFALGDSLASYGDLSLLRAMSKSAGGKFGEMWFDGTLYDAEDPVKISSVRLALDLAACSSRAPCDVDAQMIYGCMGGFCTDSRTELLRNRYVTQGGMTEAQFAEAVALGKRIRRAVDSGRVEAFVR